MKAKWLVGLVGMLCMCEVQAEFQSATISERLAGFTDENSDGVPDNLMAYLVASHVTLPNPYDPHSSNLDGDSFSDFEDWLLFLDPLVAETNSDSGGVSGQTSTGVTMRVVLPPWIKQYAELYGRENLVDGNYPWRPIEEWMPTYGAQTVEIVVSTGNNNCFFIKPFDATWDLDGDGRSDFREYLDNTDQAVFNVVDSESDGLHDWWEIRLFGDLDETATSDFDGDGLLNGEELVWVSASNIVMYSDPSLYDSDADLLNDAEEGVYQTDPMKADTDGDQLKDGDELNDRTDPNNPDTIPPVVTLFL